MVHESAALETSFALLSLAQGAPSPVAPEYSPITPPAGEHVAWAAEVHEERSHVAPVGGR